MQTAEELIAEWHGTKSEYEKARIEALLWRDTAPRTPGSSHVQYVSQQLPDVSRATIRHREILWLKSWDIPNVSRDLWGMIETVDLTFNQAVKLIDDAKREARASNKSIEHSAKLLMDQKRRTRDPVTPKKQPAVKTTEAIVTTEPAVAKPVGPRKRPNSNDMWPKIEKMVVRLVSHNKLAPDDLDVIDAVSRFKIEIDTTFKEFRNRLGYLRRSKQANPRMAKSQEPMTVSRLDIARACQDLGVEPPKKDCPFTDEQMAKARTAYKRLIVEYHPDKNKTEFAAEMLQATTHAYQLIKTYQENMTAVQPEQGANMSDDKDMPEKPKFKLKKVSLVGFKPTSDTKSGRGAELYYWARTRYPKMPIDDRTATKAVTSFGRVGVDDIENFRSVKGSIRSILLKVHHCTLITVPGYGSRATVDDQDTMEAGATVAAKRVYAADSSFLRVANVIDDKKLLPGVMRDWYLKTKSVRKELGSDEFIKALLPPGSKL